MLHAQSKIFLPGMNQRFDLLVLHEAPDRGDIEIQERIDQFTVAIGDLERIDEAQSLLDSGNVEFMQLQYEAAYQEYCEAYEALTCEDDDSDCDDDDDDDD